MNKNVNKKFIQAPAPREQNTTTKIPTGQQQENYDCNCALQLPIIIIQFRSSAGAPTE